MIELIIYISLIFGLTGLIIYWGFGDNPELRPLVFASFVPVINYLVGFFALLHVIDKLINKGCKIAHKYVEEDGKFVCQKCGKTL